MGKVSVQPHIQCSSLDAAPYALLPGDPMRVEKVKSYLKNVKEIAFNREYKSIVGSYKGVQVMVVSTGIGGPSTAVAVEELSRIGVHTMIRIGSCGALDSKIQLGDLIIIDGAVRDEGTSKVTQQPLGKPNVLLRGQADKKHRHAEPRFLSWPSSTLLCCPGAREESSPQPQG